MMSKLIKRSDATIRKSSVNNSELQPIINKESDALIMKVKKAFYQANSPDRYKIAIECYGGQEERYDIVIFIRSGTIKNSFHKIGVKTDSHVSNFSLSLKKHKTTTLLSQRHNSNLNSDWQIIYSVDDLDQEKMALLGKEFSAQARSCHCPTLRQVFSYSLFGAFSVLLFLAAKPDDLAQQWHLDTDENRVNGVGAATVFIASDLLYFGVNRGINWVKAYCTASLRTPAATFSPNSYEMQEEQMDNDNNYHEEACPKQSFQLL